MIKRKPPVATQALPDNRPPVNYVGQRYDGGIAKSTAPVANIPNGHMAMTTAPGYAPASQPASQPAGSTPIYNQGSTGGTYARTAFGTPFPNASAPNRTSTVSTPVYKYNPTNNPHKPMADRWTKTGTNRRKVANPNYARDMRNYQAQQLLNQYTTAYNEGNAANEQRYEDILGGYRDLTSQSGEMHDSRINQLADMYANMGQQINSGFQGRYDKGMGLLEGLGDTERKRINRSYDNQVGSIGANLTNRGLNNSTIAGSMQNAVNRNREESQGMLSEQLRREQLGAHTNLSGDQMSAMQNLLFSTTQGLDNATLQKIQSQTDLPLQTLNFMERREDTVPSLNDVMALYMNLGRGF